MEYKICNLCNKEIKNNKHNRSRCPYCSTRIRRYRNKIAAINFLGGKCNRCGWQGNPVGFDFHHKDGEEKDGNLGRMINKSWKTIINEIKKCELLCATCHRIEHCNHDDKLINESLNYNGQDKDLLKYINIRSKA